MINTQNCIQGSIAPFQPNADKVWDSKKVLHLYRRLGFGASLDEIENALKRSPEQLVDKLIDEAYNAPLSPTPEWAQWTFSQFENETEIFEKLNEMRADWLRRMKDQPIREKLTLFWSNHLVTQYEAFPCVTQGYSYLRLLETQAIGNFRTLVYEMGKNPGMLLYLNGAQNFKFEPNENYARELYELFTLGRDNGYTQDDITETARALTGWTFPEYLSGGGRDRCSTDVRFFDFLWDEGEKTIFGQTGNWGYDDVHELLFSLKTDLIAKHICGKLYEFYVYPVQNTEIVEALAQTLIDNEFEIAPVLKQLFKSEHFFDRELMGTHIKSPIEFQVSLAKVFDIDYSEGVEFLLFTSAVIGQDLMNPIDVAGWPGHRSWISSDRLSYRWQIVDFILYSTFEEYAERYRAFAIQLTDNSKDPAIISRAIVDFFMPNGFSSESDYDRAEIIFKGEVPQNYYENGFWDLSWESAPFQVVNLIYRISRYPEFQMN